ncbi:MAG: hypothetical protein ACLRHW_00165 [Coprobacillus cateniformis]
MEKTIKISNVVLRALVNGDYDNNMIGLQSTIRIMCASALKSAREKVKLLYIHIIYQNTF